MQTHRQLSLQTRWRISTTSGSPTEKEEKYLYISIQNNMIGEQLFEWM